MKKHILTFVLLVLCIPFVYAEEEEEAEESFQTNDAMVKSIALSDAPLSQVLYIIEELTGKAVLQDSKLGNVSINLQIRKEISKAEAIRAIESVLAINHIAIVELGDGLLKAVSMKSAPTQSPFFVDYSLLDVAPSEKICSKIFQLQHLSVDEFSKLITNLLNPEIASAIVFSDSNSMLITDSIANLQRVELILSRVDIPKHSVLDSKIFRIKHGDAKEVADLLNKVIKGQLNTRNKESGNASNGSVEYQNTLENMSSFQFSKNLTIEHDTRSNAVITCGTPKDIELVESIINQIDVLLDQVRIEVVIAKVTLTKGQASGLESLGLNNVGNAMTSEHYNPMINSTFSKAGSLTEAPFSINGTAKNFALNLVFNKARSDSHVKILSAPTIVTTHNRQALVKIVDSYPVVKSDISDSNGAASTAIKSTIEYKDVGIELQVKPLIGINGIIQLEISQRIEDKKQDVKINGNDMPSMSKSEAVSFVSVYDGDTVILAGLQQKKTTKSSGKLWLLGDIPVIGNWLFAPKGVNEETTELIIFIKPTIISNPANEKAFAERTLDGSELRPEIENYDRSGKFLPAMQFPKGTLGDPLIDYSKIPPEDNNSRKCKCGNKRKCKCKNKCKSTIISNPANEKAFAERTFDGSELRPEIENYDRSGKFLPAMQFPKGTLGDPLIDYSKIPPEDNNSRKCKCGNKRKCKCKNKYKCKAEKTDSKNAVDLTSEKEALPAQLSNTDTYAVEQPKSAKLSDDGNFIKRVKKHRRKIADGNAPSIEDTTTTKASNPKRNVMKKPHRSLINKRQGSKKFRSRNS